MNIFVDKAWIIPLLSLKPLINDFSAKEECELTHVDWVMHVK